MKRARAQRAATSTTTDAVGAEAASDETSHALKLWVVLARSYAAVARAVEKDIARHGLTTTEFGILEALHHKGPLLLGEIQRKVLVTSGGITYLVDRLVAKGLVRREPSPDDRRARYAVLTDEGARLIGGIFPPHAELLTEAMRALTPEEQGTATALLRRLGHAVAEEYDEG
jgi:MarR family 2-MHQ and catechol resistance regulon transcriptional repressor